MITHDQVGCHANILVKTLKNVPLLNERSYDLKTWHAALGHWGPELYKLYITDDPELTLTYITSRLNYTCI